MRIEVGSLVLFAHVNQGQGRLRLEKYEIEVGMFFTIKEFFNQKKVISDGPILIIGLSRPPTLKKILEHGTTMGVQQFLFYKSTLSDKSYLGSKILKSEEYEKILDLGLSQSKCYFFRPLVKVFSCQKDLLNYLNNEKSIEQYGRYLLEQNGELSLLEQLKRKGSSFNNIIAIGSERGHTQDEILEFKNNQFRETKVSNATLRVEFAAYYALAISEQLSISEHFFDGDL